MKWLVATQQFKDSVTILELNVLLLFGILCGIAIPGLILFFLRWRLVLGKCNGKRTVILWGLTLLHESFCVLLFSLQEMQSDALTQGIAGLLVIGYSIGVGISLISLILISISSSQMKECRPS
ncbi:hypothetical protein F1C16_13280 [Hymenobacter sp. NBH84]|uniref:hypothetical protein n=1 Tax=Hymenobacter sp. NBH84 TaxID=2596915 RepID=UPI001629D554|nr:hypothetical protein [Hymenobacter sp. NBH84]QNE40460.1 hypothetical protein F1C16_13280 [Hymenobacter sp. NBH84]